MMYESGVEVAKLYETANLLLRLGYWPVCNGLDFLCGNRNFTGSHSVGHVLHVLQSEEAFLKA
jgi:hypothetical protein